MKDFDSSLVHSSWLPILQPLRVQIVETLQKLDINLVSPVYSDIFRAFTYPFDSIRCVIVGQDPYPTRNFAHGLAFSVPRTVTPLPKSLQNIFRELHSDLGDEIPAHGDLSHWAANGVLLLNRVLTCEIGRSNSHVDLGWQEITEAVAKVLGDHDVVAVLWGKQAQQLSHYFTYRIESAHPSPLSAYRGFFGSRPFSRVNQMLIEQGREVIDW